MTNRIDFTENRLTHKSRVSNPRFGALWQSLAYLENNPLADIVVKDVLGFNAPKIALARTPKERLDVATLELSNTAITLGSSLTLPYLLRYPVHKLSGVPLKDLVGNASHNLGSQAKLARMGVAFGFLFPFAAAFWSAAFFRNWMTLKRHKTADFESIIGVGSNNAKGQKRSLKEEMHYQMGRALKTFGIGSALGLASVVGFSMLARKTNTQVLSKPLEMLFQKFHLAGAKSNQVNSGWATFLFWLAPAYAGWMDAARGHNERREQALKITNGVLWFSVFTPAVVKPFFLRHFQKAAPHLNLTSVPSYNQINELTGPLREKLRILKNKQFGIGLLITVAMLATTPQLINIAATRFLNKPKPKEMPETTLNAITSHASGPSKQFKKTTLPSTQYAFMDAPGLTHNPLFYGANAFQFQTNPNAGFYPYAVQSKNPYHH